MPKSYSQWGMYNQCPRKYKYQYKDKLPAPYVPSPAAERGTRIHESVEHFMLGQRPDLDEEIDDMYRDFFTGLRDEHEFIPEWQWAIGPEWEVCSYDNPSGVVRGFTDLLLWPDSKKKSLHLYEFKTGQEYDDHIHQKLLYALAAFVHFPDVKDVTVTGLYFDKGFNRITTYRAEMLINYKWMWERRFKQMDNDEVCAPNPSFKCKWCAFSKAKGGPCAF